MASVRGAFPSILGLSFLGGVLTVFLPHNGSLLAGSFALYLTLTSWMTARTRHTAGYFEFFALLMVLCLVASGVEIALTSNGSDAGYDVLLAGIAAIAAAGDLSLLIRKQVHGRQRLMRHVWRLSAALLIAGGSIAATGDWLRLLAMELAVVLALALWIVHVRFSTAVC